MVQLQASHASHQVLHVLKQWELRGRSVQPKVLLPQSSRCLKHSQAQRHSRVPTHDPLNHPQYRVANRMFWNSFGQKRMLTVHMQYSPFVCRKKLFNAGKQLASLQ